MGALADSGLISQATPALTDGYDEELTDGRSVLLVLDDVTDGSGNPLDFSTITAICAAWAKPSDTDPVVTFDTAWSTVDAKTRLQISATDATMRGLLGGYPRARTLVWDLIFDDGTDSIAVWAAADSTLMIVRS